MPKVHIFFDGMAFLINNKTGVKYPTKELIDRICTHVQGEYVGSTFYVGINKDRSKWEEINSSLMTISSVPGLVVKRFPQKDTYTRCRCGQTTRHAQEKETDTTLALDMVCGAFTGQYDIAVLYTIDSDMRPVLVKLRELGKPCYLLANRINDLPNELKEQCFDYFTVHQLDSTLNLDLSRALLSLLNTQGVIYKSYFQRQLTNRWISTVDGEELLKQLEEQGKIIKKKDNSGDVFFLMSGDI